MNYFDVSSSGFTLRVFYEVNQGVVSIVDLQMQSLTFRGTWFPGGTISVNGVPVITMDYNVPATHKVEFPGVGETFRKVVPTNTGDGTELPVHSEQILTGKATIEVALVLYRDADTNKQRLSGSKTIDVDFGLVHIGDKAFMPYIDNGTDWDPFCPQIANGSSWDIFS